MNLTPKFVKALKKNDYLISSEIIRQTETDLFQFNSNTLKL